MNTLDKRVQVLAAAHELFIMPVEEGDVKMYYTGAAGFYELTGKPHSTMFRNAETLGRYIQKVERAGYDEIIVDPFELLPNDVYHYDMFDEEEFMSDEERRKIQTKATELKTAIMELVKERTAIEKREAVKRKSRGMGIHYEDVK